MALWMLKILESKSWVFWWIKRESGRNVVLVHKKWDTKSENHFFRCIESLKFVVYSGWCIDDNGNIVNTWGRWGWLSKMLVFEKNKKNSRIFVNNLQTFGVNMANESSKNSWFYFVFDFEFWVIFATRP